MSMDGFQIVTIGGEASSVKYSCSKCGAWNPFVTRNNLTSERRHNKDIPCDACSQHVASNEVMFAIDAATASHKQYEAEEKLNSNKSSLTVFILFGLLPILGGLLFGSSESISSGVIIILMFGVYHIWKAWAN